VLRKRRRPVLMARMLKMVPLRRRRSTKRRRRKRQMQPRAKLVMSSYQRQLQVRQKEQARKGSFSGKKILK